MYTYKVNQLTGCLLWSYMQSQKQNRKLQGDFRSLSFSLSDVTRFFPAFSLKGPNSQVAQIPHCTGERKKSKKGVREKSNLIQLKQQLFEWVTQHWGLGCFFFFFYANLWEGKWDQRDRWGGREKKQKTIFPFWKTLPPEDSLRSWERRKEKLRGWQIVTVRNGMAGQT